MTDPLGVIPCSAGVFYGVPAVQARICSGQWIAHIKE